MAKTGIKFNWVAARVVALVCCTICFCTSGISSARAQTAPSPQQSESNLRLLTAEEGRVIVNTAWGWDPSGKGTQDCSHLVHQVYLAAGYEYPYASSFDIYAGNENFGRVKTPQAGDVVAWPGHVGIIVDPLQHSFYSLVNTGFEAQDYAGPYWRSRGRPRFYRYRVEDSGSVTVAKAAAAPGVPKSAQQRKGAAVPGERSAEYSASNKAPKAASERTAVINSRALPAPPETGTAIAEVPSSILIAAAGQQPTRSEVAAAISELSSATGNVLRAGDPSKLQMPVVIYERLDVERVDIKRDHGWARLRISSRARIAGGEADSKRRHEMIRWELRRTESGWEAVAPTDRMYVPNEVAVRDLAAQLARLTETDGAAANQETVLRQESQLANLLSALLEK
jgi:hypothetical protein